MVAGNAGDVGDAGGDAGGCVLAMLGGGGVRGLMLGVLLVMLCGCASTIKKNVGASSY